MLVHEGTQPLPNFRNVEGPFEKHVVSPRVQWGAVIWMVHQQLNAPSTGSNTPLT